MGTFSRLVLVLLALLSFSLTPPPAPAAEWRDVTDDRLANAGSDPANWLMYSRTYNGWRYSPLDQINTGNIKKLVPKWIFAGGVLGEQQMTPVVNSGAMFTTSTALGVNRVHALNAVTGELLKAFEAELGKSRWRWYSAPAAGEPGSETWQADTWKIGGGAVWHTGTYDPATNLLYVGTGNPAPWIADMRRGENLYTMSAVAPDGDPGEMKWDHQ